MLSTKRYSRFRATLTFILLFAIIMGADNRRSSGGTAYAADGDLDTGFGTGGKVTTDFVTPGKVNEARAIAIQPDGKILVAGNVHIDGSNYDFGLVRYNTNGSLDTSFGNNGWSTADFGGPDDRAYGVAIQPDGKIVAAGSSGPYPARGYDFAVARFNSNGFLDTSFGIYRNGREIVTYSCPPLPCENQTAVANGVAIQSDGKIVIAGYKNEGSVTNFALARLLPDGNLDNSFDGDAHLTTDFLGAVDQAGAVAVQPNGRIVVAGTAQKSGYNYDFALARYKTDGSLDTSFDKDGKATFDFFGGDDGANAIALQPDGRIVAAGGFFSQANGYDFGVLRYNSDGSLDSGFGGGGFQAINFLQGTAEEIGQAVALQPDGKIVVAGYAEGAGKDFAIARLNPNGSLDNTFGGGDGKIITDFGGGNDSAQGVAIQGDGKIVTAGTAAEDFALARYLSGGAPPPPPAPTATSAPPPNPTSTPTPTPAPTSSRYFAATGHTVRGLFLDYWDANGGLAQQGYPITEELQEKSDTDGKTYTVQYFQRSVFEYHPEQPDPKYKVLLSLLGVFYYNDKYGGNASNQHASTTDPRYFSQTGKTIGGAFRRYWEAHGGLAQQGYPISNEFQEVSQTDGKTYTVQYFQRAVFEYHPEFAGTQNQVLLSLLGVFRYDKKYGGSVQPTVPTPPTPTPVPVAPISQILFLKNNGTGQSALIDANATVFNQQAIQLPPNNYTAVESLGGGYIFAYDPSGRGTIGKVNEDGTFQRIKSYSNLYAGWTYITSFQNILFFLDTRHLPPYGNGLMGTVRLNVPIDGNFVELPRYASGTELNVVVATVNGVVVTYKTDGPGSNQLGVTKVDTDGNMSGTHALVNVVEPGWTHITRIQNDYLLFYNRTTGDSLYGKILDNPNVLNIGFTRGVKFRLGANWTNFAATTNGMIIEYNRDVGGGLAIRANIQTNDYTFVSSGPLVGINTGWNYVLPLR